MNLSKNAVVRALLIFVALLVTYSLVPKMTWGSEAPGCGAQSLRPRLTQCCPTYQYALEHDREPLSLMPPKCSRAYREGFLAECCGEPLPPESTPEPEPTCPPGWNCPTPQPTYVCTAPSPLPTPISRSKGECCKEVRVIYAEARRAIVADKNTKLKALIAWRKDQMEECREDYVQP